MRRQWAKERGDDVSLEKRLRRGIHDTARAIPGRWVSGVVDVDDRSHENPFVEAREGKDDCGSSKKRTLPHSDGCISFFVNTNDHQPAGELRNVAGGLFESDPRSDSPSTLLLSHRLIR